MRKGLVILIVALLVIGLIGGWIFFQPRAPSPTPTPAPTLPTTPTPTPTPTPSEVIEIASDELLSKIKEYNRAQEVGEKVPEELKEWLKSIEGKAIRTTVTVIQVREKDEGFISFSIAPTKYVVYFSATLNKSLTFGATTATDSGELIKTVKTLKTGDKITIEGKIELVRRTDSVLPMYGYEMTLEKIVKKD